MQTRKRRGSKGNDNSDEISFDSGSESGEKSGSDFSEDGVKSGANSVQPSPVKQFSFREKPAQVKIWDHNATTPSPRRSRRNSNISEPSGETTEDKKKKSANMEKKDKSKQSNTSSPRKNADRNSDRKITEAKKKHKEDNDSDHKSEDHSDSDVSMHDDSDASGPQYDSESSSGYESESESGEVKKKRPSSSGRYSRNRRQEDKKKDDSRKHYPKRNRHKHAQFDMSLLTRNKKKLFPDVDPDKTVLTRSQLKALDHLSKRGSEPNGYSSIKTPSSTKTHVSNARREPPRERRPPPPPTPRSNSLKKLDEMISDSDSSDESDFDDDDTSTIRRSKRVRKSVDRFQPSPNKKEREKEKKRAREAARAQGRAYNSDGSSTYSSDEYQEFREKAVLTLKPINTKARDQIAVGPNRNTTIGDITPMDIDKSVNWTYVGGLDHHVKALKEMVLFPLLYPEIFQRFQIAPPKGVLFYGPPGTGKTLVARALANTCSSSSGQKISFFMRKGADILSKWVGEAERQLRLLFDEARRLQPSIIFFDEIDGLAPVRSSKQDQIHSSIVSTLLALMDGLDNRGQVIVIGATNRIDAIDPALRRPGRFDREFLFTLPSKIARREIMSIHTQKWDPPINTKLRDEIADHCVGYCGADLKALCSEAVLNALRRNYPQIYEREQKLLLDPSKIIVSSHDFIKAMKSITPASHRSVAIHARPLLRELQPLLETTFNSLLERMKKVFPFGSSIEQLDKEFEIVDPTRTAQKSDDNGQEIDRLALETELYDLEKRYTTQQVFRPRLLITGTDGNGQSHLGAALLHQLEEFPVFSADLSTLHADLFSRSLEEAFVTRFNEAIKKLPAVLFIPHLDTWWNLATPALQESFMTSMKDIEPTLPLLLIATTDSTTEKLPNVFKQVFTTDNIVESASPTADSREEFFQDIIKLITKPALKKRKRRKMKELPLAPPPAPREPTPEELEAQRQADEHCMRLLRMEIRDILDKIRGQRKYQSFFKTMSLEMYPDYYEVVKEPMDLLTIQRRNDENYYITFDMFLEDLNLVMSNVGLYFNEHNDHSHLLSKVRAMRDLINALFIEVSKETVINCMEIAKSGRIVPGRKVPPQLPPKPAPIDLVNEPTTEQHVREEEHRRHSARLKGETIPNEVLFSFAEDAVREKRRRKKEMQQVQSKEHHQDEDAHSDNDHQSEDEEKSHSQTAKDKPNKDKDMLSKEKDTNNNNNKDENSKGKKSLKRKRDEQSEEEDRWLKSNKRPRTDDNLSNNKNNNKKSSGKDEVNKEKEEKSTVDLSIEELVEERSMSTKDSVALASNINNASNTNHSDYTSTTTTHQKITFNIDPDLLPVNNTNENNTNENGLNEQMQVVVEEESESEEEEPIQPIEIDQKQLNRFKASLVHKTEGMSVDQLHAVFVALQNCAYEERFNHQRDTLLATMKKTLHQFVESNNTMS